MAGQNTGFRGFKSLAGGVLVGLGIFILYREMAGAITGLRHLLGANGSGALGVVPAVVFAVSKGLQTCAADHQRFVQCFLKHSLVSFWPLLLVRVGTVLSRDAFMDDRCPLSKN